MAPLITLVAVSLACFVLSRTFVPRVGRWPNSIRFGVVAMFTVTGISHFVGMRESLIEMVPPALPFPDLIVTVTGVLELAGAAGLLWSRTSIAAAAGLTLMLVAMFPANVHLALSEPGLPFNDLLLPRTLMQIVFVTATVIVFSHDLRRARGDAARNEVRARA